MKLIERGRHEERDGSLFIEGLISCTQLRRVRVRAAMAPTWRYAPSSFDVHYLDRDSATIVVFHTPVVTKVLETLNPGAPLHPKVTTHTRRILLKSLSSQRQITEVSTSQAIVEVGAVVQLDAECWLAARCSSSTFGGLADADGLWWYPMRVLMPFCSSTTFPRWLLSDAVSSSMSGHMLLACSAFTTCGTEWIPLPLTVQTPNAANNEETSAPLVPHPIPPLQVVPFSEREATWGNENATRTDEVSLQFAAVDDFSGVIDVETEDTSDVFRSVLNDAPRSSDNRRRIQPAKR